MIRNNCNQLYNRNYFQKFQMKLQHTVKGLRTMVPIFYRNFHYILAGTDDSNVIFRIIKQGPKQNSKIRTQN